MLVPSNSQETQVAKWITKTASGRYKARLAIPAQGTRNKTFDRRIDAEKWLTAHQGRIDRGDWIDPQIAATPFGVWAADWVASRSHLKPKTFEGYKSLLRVHLVPRFGSMPLQRIDPGAVDKWVQDLSLSGQSASRIRQAHQLLSMILKAAVRARMISFNAAEGTPLPRILPRQPRFLTSEQVDLLAAETPDQYRALIYTLAYGGLRWAEAVGLKRGDVNLLRRRIEVRETLSEVNGLLHQVPPKTWEQRSVAIPPFVADILGGHIGSFCDSGADSLTFTTATGTPLRSANFRRAVWLPATSAIGQRGIRIHDLRHTCASLLIAAEAHPHHIKEHLGHSSIRVTMDVYGHLYEDRKDDVALRMEDLRNASSGRKTS
jgi:integrase